MNQFAKPGLGEEKLPPVGSPDNGKVLGVSEGAWAKIAAPSGLPEVGADDKDKYLHTNASTGEPEWASGGGGGGGSSVVALHPTEVGNYIVLDKTYSEIRSAMLAGNMVVCFWNPPDDDEPEGSELILYSYVSSVFFDVYQEDPSLQLYTVEMLAPDAGFEPRYFVCDSRDDYPKYLNNK